STGACTELEMMLGLGAVMNRGPSVTILHCVSAYPAPLSQMNLLVLKRMRQTFGFSVKLGLSDHTAGNIASQVALGLGATVFEKHFTWDKHQKGPDHKASLDPIEMDEYVCRLRLGYEALGDGVKRIMPCEKTNREWYDHFIERRLLAGAVESVDTTL